MEFNLLDLMYDHYGFTGMKILKFYHSFNQRSLLCFCYNRTTKIWYAGFLFIFFEGKLFLNEEKGEGRSPEK